MANPFVTALRTLHGSVGAVTADFITVDGSVVEGIRVIRGQISQSTNFAGGEIVFDTNHVQIMRSDVDDPTEGRLLMLGEEYLVQGAPRLDDEGLAWHCALEPA